MSMKVRIGALLGLAVTLSMVACGEEALPPVDRARPVTVITLVSESPVPAGDFVGVAESFREEDIGFEVNGRVLLVERLGAEVSGPVLDASGRVTEDGRGSVLARLDPERYRLAVKSAQLAVAAARSTLKTREVDATVASPAEIKRSEAQARAAEQEIMAAREDVKAKQAAFDLAKGNLAREKNLQSSGAGTQQDLDNAQRDFDSAEARLGQGNAGVAGKTQAYDAALAAVASAKASGRLKMAMVEEARAEVSRLENEEARAQENLDDCTLYAPFSGRVTQELIGRGGIVASGQPVARLTMMDPIKLVITATGDESRVLTPGKRVRVMPAGPTLPAGLREFEGTVIGKPEVADPATRTFRIEVLVRNVNQKTRAGKGVQLIRNVMPVLLRERGADGPLHVPADAVFEKDGKAFVLRIVKASDRQSALLDPGKVYKPDRVEVKRTGKYFTIVSWTFAEIEEGSGLSAGDIVVLNPTPESEQGVTLAGFEWVIRPGDLVPMSFHLGGLPAGMYVPVRAIRYLNGNTSVFVVGDGDVVTETPVTVHETWRDRRRVTGVAPGSRVVVDGLHYIASGDTVVATPLDGGASR